ncbi:MAG: hypothetical protein H6730_28485 [Deltaproteobacteria bacterium]|nr:hypothetical protein [Deltaproteobacteria bacterium]
MRAACLSVGAFALSLLSSACAIPHSSFARPVSPAGEGSRLISAGVLVPVAGAASGPTKNQRVRPAPIPIAAVDYALGDRHYVGLGVAVLPEFGFFEFSGKDPDAVVLNPRWELELAADLSVTADGMLVLGMDGGKDTAVSFSGGLRYYVPAGPGGFILSQQFGFSFASVSLPGGVAYDIPISLGEGRAIHLFPELRWDPNVGVESEDLTLTWIIASVGGSIMIDL